jgi:hypothetical protein
VTAATAKLIAVLPDMGALEAALLHARSAGGHRVLQQLMATGQAGDSDVSGAVRLAGQALAAATIRAHRSFSAANVPPAKLWSARVLQCVVDNAELINSGLCSATEE